MFEFAHQSGHLPIQTQHDSASKTWTKSRDWTWLNFNWHCLQSSCLKHKRSTSTDCQANYHLKVWSQDRLSFPRLLWLLQNYLSHHPKQSPWLTIFAKDLLADQLVLVSAVYDQSQSWIVRCRLQLRVHHENSFGKGQVYSTVLKMPCYRSVWLVRILQLPDLLCNLVEQCWKDIEL